MKNKFKILTMGKLSGISTEIEEKELAKLNIEADFISARFATEDELTAVAKDVDVILGGGRFFTRRVMEALPKCLAIITYSVGYDGIDIDAATDNGILVVNNPASNWCIEEVSNHAITLLLACAKKLALLNDWTKHGRWAESRQDILSSMQPIHGQVLGLVGCGAIARMMAKKAQCFGMRTIGYDPYLDQSLAEECNIELVSLPELLKESDFISIHTPLNKETWHLIGESEFKQMKSTAYFINTGRGGIVDEASLIKALQEKWIAGAGLDVFEKEPIDPDNPLFKMDNILVTPHSASFSKAALELQPVNPTQEAARVLSGRWPKNVVNQTVIPKVELTR